MNKKINLIIMQLFCIISCVYPQDQALFLERIQPIKKNLFKLSPEELCEMLGITHKPVPIITADQLKQELETNKPLVVNVLTKNYFEDCHIAGSINAALPELIDKALAWDRSQKIVIYCALEECDAGEKGCILLQCMGFTNVLDYKGGIKEWYQLNFPTVGPATSEYLHMKSFDAKENECLLYPMTIVCSRQTRWMHKYQN